MVAVVLPLVVIVAVFGDVTSMTAVEVVTVMLIE
jgi:hypothetical protein